MWNDLIKIRDSKKTNPDSKRMAEMLLRQLNTAGGKELIGHEVEAFINDNKHYIK